jgi:hypothetical protein
MGKTLYESQVELNRAARQLWETILACFRRKP